MKNETVEQRLPYVKEAVERWFPPSNEAVEGQRFPFTNEAVEQWFPAYQRGGRAAAPALLRGGRAGAPA
ncbi:hypothetical protein PF010_g28031 [Phytophthora fragariae]|nr:hypothetical protein PF003_g16652 [Phytophthora fragariae]KAE8935906.1 hypothetical protein PF009_g14147 [Phytophthora fragariae]KAE9065870.1 hypothetical protein PF010_g28031 [Phytophthora fragariae]KAE9066221.1 hypothetical protein PF007_g28559 [Phytophthora fragariae]KAE9076647.1 hypothetical protein PF006_g28087 [Phytophthora fragariae]